MTSLELDVAAAAAEFAGAVSEIGSVEIERQRRMPPELARRAVALGLMRLLAPRELGAPEADPATLVRTLETIARADASAGWVVMIAATTSVMGGTFPLDVAREVLGPSDSVLCGVAAPLGRARRVPGGLRLTGRWPFGSGSQVATWLVGGSLVFDGEAPALLPNGAQEMRLALFPVADATILDTWHVNGLRGTGSNDYEVSDILVREGYSTIMGVDRPWCERALYAFPIWGLLSLGIAAVALGVARAAIDEFVALAGAKTPIGASRKLAERPGVQEQVARAEATLRGARAFLFEAIDRMWQTAARGDRPTMDDRALLRLASTNCAHSATAAVDAMYTAGGSTSNYDASPLQRHFRDIHALTQHVMVQPTTWEMTGRVLLGLPPNTLML